jgi:putative tricarboxylic transport membrane protein
MLFGLWFLWQATALRAGPGYAAVGPRVFPLVVGAGFVLSGLALALSGRRYPRRAATGTTSEEGTGSATVAGGVTRAEAADEAADWPALLGMAALLLAYVVLFRPLGFPLTSAVFLPLGAAVLGSRAHGRDALVALLISLAAYVVFTRLLGLEVPAGPLAAPLDTVLDRVPGLR